MRVFVVIAVLSFLIPVLSAQESTHIRSGISADQNLREISQLSPTSVGGYGFDGRYEGIRGTPRLYDTLYQSYLKIKDQDFHLRVKADLDIFTNRLLFSHPSTGKLMTIPSEIIEEVIIVSENGEQLFFTTEGMTFDKSLKELSFCQILFQGKYIFIKIPGKTFRKADYKAAYSSGRAYDEYREATRYYLAGKNEVLNQVTITRKNLLKLFPDKKELVNKVIDEGNYKNDEEMVIEILRQL